VKLFRRIVTSRAFLDVKPPKVEAAEVGAKKEARS